MNKNHALRFLLLKHLWKLRSHAEPARHRFIARSLKVDRISDKWLVKWFDGEKNCAFEFSPEDISFYVRGDSNNKHYVEVDDSKNESLGEKFACIALDITPRQDVAIRKIYFSYQVINIILFILTIVVMAATISSSKLLTIVMISMMMLAEFWFRRGKILNSFIGLALSLFGLQATSLVTNFSLSVLNFLDPDKKWRLFRVLAHSVAALVALVNLVYYSSSQYNIKISLCFLVISFLISVYRWLFGSHFRLFPLVFPLASAGLILDGEWLTGLIGLSGSLIEFCVSLVTGSIFFKRH